MKTFSFGPCVEPSVAAKRHLIASRIPGAGFHNASPPERIQSYGFLTTTKGGQADLDVVDQIVAEWHAAGVGLELNRIAEAATGVTRLDFSQPAPGAVISPPPVHRRNARPGPTTIATTWVKYKAENDPPGLTVWPTIARQGQIEQDVWVFSMLGAEAGLDWFVEKPEARTAAWRWYEARLALYNVLRTLNPPREFWPLILTWSEQDVLGVHAFLSEHFDDFLLGCADMLTFPEVLRG